MNQLASAPPSLGWTAGSEECSVPPSCFWLDEAPRRERRIALGSFDGLHRGHRAVIERAETVLTFSPHPRAIIGSPPPLIQDEATKFETLAELGVAEVVLIPFDRDIAAMTPQSFIDSVLVETLGAARVSVGANFHFGSGGRGGVADLQADGRFETVAVPLLSAEGEVISSTRIRGLLGAGRVEAAQRLLGQPFKVPCTVSPNPTYPGELIWPSDLVRVADGRYEVTLEQIGARKGRPRAADLVVEADQVSVVGVGGLLEFEPVVFVIRRRKGTEEM
jgi:FAD synthase